MKLPHLQNIYRAMSIRLRILTLLILVFIGVGGAAIVDSAQVQQLTPAKSPELTTSARDSEKTDDSTAPSQTEETPAPTQATGITPKPTTPASGVKNGAVSSSNPTPPRDNSTALPVATVVPINFTVILSSHAAWHPYPDILAVPFAIRKYADYSGSPSTSCQPVSGPGGTHGAHCSKWGDSPETGDYFAYIPPDAPDGDYTFKITASDGAQSNSAIFVIHASAGSLSL
jgi:hypothetical protein